VLSPRPEADATGKTVVAPPGDLDFPTATALGEALHEALSPTPKTIILDLGLVTSLDRSGFSILVSALREVRTLGVGIAVSGEMTPKVRRVVEIALFVSVFDPLYPEVT
jgi:anti-anti-sigma factor